MLSRLTLDSSHPSASALLVARTVVLYPASFLFQLLITTALVRSLEWAEGFMKDEMLVVSDSHHHLLVVHCCSCGHKSVAES